MTSSVSDDIAPGTVVVGLDWSNGARSAVDYALRDAARRGVGVDVVTVYEPLEAWAWAFVGVDTHDVAADDAAAESAARQVVDDVVAAVRDDLGDALPDVTVHVRRGRPAEM